MSKLTFTIIGAVLFFIFAFLVSNNQTTLEPIMDIQSQPVNPRFKENTQRQSVSSSSIVVAFNLHEAKTKSLALHDLDKYVSNENNRFLLKAYSTETGQSQSRRMSLSRALFVRQYLLEKGIRSTRIDVRALGNKNPVDRVEVFVIQR